MPPICIEHTRYYKEGQWCAACGVKAHSEAKEKNKAANTIAKTFNKKISSIAKANEKKKESQKLVKEILAKHPNAKLIKPSVKSMAALIEEGQKYLSLNFKKKYCPNEFTNCSVCNKPVPTKGNHIMNTIHCAHLYPKGIYWGLMFEEANLAPACFEHNVDKPQAAPAMRNWMIKTYGEKALKELDKKAEKFMQDMNLGIIKSRPDTLYLQAEIHFLKTKGI